MRDDLLAARAKNAALRRELKDTTDRLLAAKSVLDERLRQEEEGRQEEARAAEAERAKREMMVRWARNRKRRPEATFIFMATMIIVLAVVMATLSEAMGQRPLLEVVLSGSTDERYTVVVTVVLAVPVSMMVARFVSLLFGSSSDSL